MNTINHEYEADSDSSPSSEILSEEESSSYEVEDMSSNKAMDIMKKVNKLRSMKLLAKFPSLKLITRQMRIQPDYSSLFSSHAPTSHRSTPLKLLHLSPNYMKTTNSSDAKKETLQKPSRNLIKRSSFKPGKSFTRLSSTRYRNSLTRRGSGGTDLKKKAKKSRTTTLVNQHFSVSSNAADTPKILQPTNARNPLASPRDSVTSLSANLENRNGNTGVKNSLVSSGNKSTRVMTRTTTLRPVRILTKVASLRTKRPSIKRSSEIPDPSVRRATCASALKESKFPDNVELQPGGSESEAISSMKVCPYSYCSLHGHLHSRDLPPLKRFVSMRRRQLGSQKSTQSESWSARQKRSGNRKKENQTTQMTDSGDALILGTEHECDSVSIREPTAEQSPYREETNENSAADHEFNTADTGAKFSSETSTMEKQKHMGLWGLIYKHMASGIAAGEEGSLRARDEVLKNEVEDSNISDQTMSIEGQERGQLYQNNAIKLVQEAFDKILSEIPDQSSDDKLMDDDASAYKDVSEESHSVSTSTLPDSGGDNAEQDQERMLHPVSKTDPTEGGKAHPTAESKSSQQAPKRWSNLKKVILLRRFLKSLEKVSSFIPQKPRYLPVSHGPDAEKVNLRRQEMLGRKASEEWMLDYALQQVVSALAPAQRRKVALLVEAFETVAPLPEMSNLSPNVEASPQATPAENSTDLQEQKDNESEQQINFGVLLRRTPQHDLDIKKDQNDVSEIQAVDPNPESCSDASEAIYGSNLTTAGDLTSMTVVRDKNEEVAFPSFKGINNNNSLKGVRAESADSDLKETEYKLGYDYQSSPKSADVQIPCSEEFLENREVIEVDTKPALEDHECGLSSHNKEPGQVISPCTEQSEEMDSQAISNAYAHPSASDSLLQGTSSEATVGETMVKNKILQRFSNLLEESKSIKTTGADLEKQLEKQKNMRLWLMIYKHMASGTTTALEKTGDDYTKNDSKVMFAMPDAPSQDANTVNDDSVDQTIKLQQIEAIRLVEEAIDGIQLPENQDDSPEDQSVTSDFIPDNDHLEREFVQDRELLISSPTDSIKEEDRTTLNVEEPSLASLASSDVIYEGKAEGLKKSGNETKSAMKNWSNLKKLILLRRFVKSLQKVNKFNPRGPRFLPFDPDKETEKVNLRHQDVDDRKNADEWMLDHALQQVVAKLTPARKRKVALLVEAFETVIPTMEN